MWNLFKIKIDFGVYVCGGGGNRNADFLFEYAIKVNVDYIEHYVVFYSLNIKKKKEPRQSCSKRFYNAPIVKLLNR